MEIKININKERIVKALKLIFKIVFCLGIIVLAYTALLFILKDLDTELSKTILAYIEVFLWPLVVLIFILTFKVNIANFLDRVKEFDSPIGKLKADALESQKKEAMVLIL